MAFRDLYNNLGVVQLLTPQSINDTDTTSSLLDKRGFDSAAILVAIGNSTGLDADSTLEVFIQESDTTADADFTAVAVADLQRDTTGLSSATTAGLVGTLNLATEDQVTIKVGYLGSKRYIRAKLDFTTGTGGITACPACVVGLLGNAHQKPVSAPAAVTAT